MDDVIELWHGTTREAAEAIAAEGLRAGTCLTTSDELARYYAECACDELELDYDEVALVRINLPRATLTADHAALSEPVWAGIERLRVDDWELSEIVEAADVVDAAFTLERVASCRTRSAAPAGKAWIDED